MSEHVGNVGDRVELTVKLVREYGFDSYFGYNKTTMIYTMEDEAGNVFVWKTSGVIKKETVRADGLIDTDVARKGDTIGIKATVKGHSEYKGEKQTELVRVKAVWIDHAPTKAELDAARAKEQRASLGEGDFVWRMPYRQYKDHYSDCETIAGSFRRCGAENTVEVIIRDGRLVNNGTRFKHYSAYRFVGPDGKKSGWYRAVSWETAFNQLKKDYPDVSGFERDEMRRYDRWYD